MHQEQKEAAWQSNGKHEVLQIDFAVNPKTPLTNLSDSFYKQILGTYLYIVTSSATRSPRTTVYIYFESIAKKGADEVVSIICLYLKEKLSDSVKVLDIWCDGCTRQVWNNVFILFLEQVADPNSFLHHTLAPNMKWLTLSRNSLGHTYMETDMDGGQIAKKGWEILHN